jgi:hypothetical protein
MATSKKAKREDATPMPISRAKERLSEYLSDKSPEEIVATLADIQQHPDYLAMRRLEEFLTQAHFAPEIRASAVMSDFVFLMREVLAEFVPGTQLGDVVEPLRRLMANHGGGRPLKADPAEVARTQNALEAAWHPAPQREAAQKHGITDRTARKYTGGVRKKPG